VNASSCTRPARRSGIRPQHPQHADECLYGLCVGLWTAVGGHGAPGIELAQNVRAPEEVAVLLAEAEQAGGKIVRPAARAEWGGMSGAFADPDGYVWEVAHNPGWTITDDGSTRI
jgi:uncharacterized glyoxalase superfamily protein PhnB